MFFYELKIGAKNFLLAFAATIGIFSFVGIEIGSPNSSFQLQKTELFSSDGIKLRRVFVFAKAIKSPATENLTFRSKENYKRLVLLKNLIDKTCFDVFSENLIVQNLSECQRFLSRSDCSDELPSGFFLI